MAVANAAAAEMELVKAKLISAMNAIPISVALVEGPELRYTFTNAAHDRYFFKKKNFVGQRLIDVMPEITSREMLPPLQYVYKTGIPFDVQEKELTLRNSDGTYSPSYFTFSLNPLRLSDGTIFGVIATALDVTKRVLLDRENKDNRDHIKKTEGLLAQAVSLANIGFYEWNMIDNSITYSERFKKDWGVEDGTSVSDLFTQIIPEDRERVRTLVQAAIKNQTPYRAEYQIHRKCDGVTLWVELQGSVKYADDGTPMQFFGTSLNITDRKDAELRLASEKDRLDQIFAKSPAAMATWVGPDLIFDRVNLGYQQLFPNRQLIGKPISEVCPEFADQGFVEKIKNVMDTGTPYIGREVLMKIQVEPGGMTEDRHFNFSYIPIRDSVGIIRGVYDHAVDVTETVKARQIVENARLSSEEANQAKSKFLTNISHEIRSPLGAIIGYLDLLRSGELKKSEAANYIKVILRNSDHLLCLVDDILDLSKVEAGMLMLEKISFSLVDLLSDFISVKSIKAQNKGIQFKVLLESKIPDFIVTDPTRLRQILNNVVGNAIKFTKVGQVTLTIGFNQEELIFSVNDTGIGVTPEQAERLFNPFQQADNSTTRKFGGSGLGLVLTRKLCESMGGDFILEKSTLGVGSTFTARIKIQVPENARMVSAGELIVLAKNDAPTIPEVLPYLGGAKILLIEDSLDNQILFKLLLTRQGAKVDVANDGVEGVFRALHKSYDVVLCDMQMPNKDGYQTVRELRAQDYSIPIIALTAHAMKDEYARAMQAGFSDYLTKPVNKMALFETVEKYLKLKNGVTQGARPKPRANHGNFPGDEFTLH